MFDVMTSQTLRDGRRALVGFAAGTALLAAMYGGFYPQIADGAMEQTVQGFSPGLREALRMDDLVSAAGYLGSSVFGIIVPLIAVGYGITVGTRAVAGDEEAGHLDLLLAHPVSRTRLVLARFAALATGALLIAGTVWLAMLTIRSGARLQDVSVTQFAAQCAALALLVVAFGAIALTVGAVTGNRAVTLGVTAGVAVLSYALRTMAGPVGVDGLRYLSPFYYYDGGEPLRYGFQWTHLAVLVGLTALLVAVATRAFDRRDLTS
ncbi:ABC transporter permease subunit [Micromonospora eburnea]|uniref:ABC-2 type transport system permease protein n=1 Tax=Micromonospora eburnea TaxID=227316 RepID=A0A1C6TSL7_9ACTN|nr:ABC transporter permease subunit [Micromonospora eburnea]SCL44621.1 ABC-2 type transport system permease protein [Micromonospora eburnea]